MAFYTADLKIKTASKKKAKGKRSIIIDIEDVKYTSKVRTLMQDLNNGLGYRCHNDMDFSIYFTNYLSGVITIAVSTDSEKCTISDCKRFLNRYLEKTYDVEEVIYERLEECAAIVFHRLGEMADENNYIPNWFGETKRIGIDFFDNSNFKLEEQLYDGRLYPSVEDAIKDTGRIICSKALRDELERIFSNDNEKKYYGNPVHYKVTASNKKAAEEIVHILHKSLKKNKRLVSSRIAWIYGIEDCCYDVDDVVDIFRSSKGGMVVIETSGNNAESGNYASTYQEVAGFFSRVIAAFQRYTLCVFVEIAGKGGFGNALLSRVQEDIDILEIDEGVGNIETAREVLCNIALKDKESISEQDISEILGEQKEFFTGEIYTAYDRWYKNQLKRSRYRSYMNCEKLEVETYGKKNDPYKELSDMIGLGEVKRIVDDIIDTANVRQMRKAMSLPCDDKSMHMVFTGNPGSAKTTVARLIAEILKKEGILESGKFVECGRADLVGKYVGWTAKTVRAKFREAEGGILFIDEAYSLLDDSNSFGAEAINTIVQEMENKRDSVVVIFAGYPKKMEEFLESNEGLSSRITFHLDFPDYKPKELCQILEFMTKRRGYKLGEGSYEKCLEVCDKACRSKDYGNGRFARNLLEQAEMAQAHRIMGEKKVRAIKKEDLMILTPADFEVNIEKNLKNKKVIGFGA